MHEPSAHRCLAMALTTLAAACTDRSVTIERTTYGMPHITANDPESLATAWRTPPRKTTSA